MPSKLGYTLQGSAVVAHNPRRPLHIEKCATLLSVNFSLCRHRSQLTVERMLMVSLECVGYAARTKAVCPTAWEDPLCTLLCPRLK